MDGILKFNDVVSYIEDNLDKEIDVEKMAKTARMSVYEFRRIFTFVVGAPIGEYIRKRRLSKAAEELVSGKNTVTEIALKYGYDAAASFTRAFKAFHGVSPTDVVKGGCKLTVYTKIGFDFCARGGEEISYRLLKDDGFYVVGYSENSDLEDTECCERVWNAFYENEWGMSALNACEGQIYAAYANGVNSVLCTIGARENAVKDKGEKDDKARGDRQFIPASLWACFTLKGAKDEVVNAFYKNVLFGFLNSGASERVEDVPNLEVFPVDMDGDDFEWEIRVPIKEKGV